MQAPTPLSPFFGPMRDFLFNLIDTQSSLHNINAEIELALKAIKPALVWGFCVIHYKLFFF